MISLATALCAVVLAVTVPTSAAAPAGVPNRLAPALAQFPRGTAVLVEDGTGAWMEWRFPGLQPVIDGLLDAYPVDYIRRVGVFWGAGPGWRNFVADTGARVAVTLRGSAVTTALRLDLHWRVAATDRRWVLLTAPGTTVAR